MLAGVSSSRLGHQVARLGDRGRVGGRGLYLASRNPRTGLAQVLLLCGPPAAHFPQPLPFRLGYQQADKCCPCRWQDACPVRLPSDTPKSFCQCVCPLPQCGLLGPGCARVYPRRKEKKKPPRAAGRTPGVGSLADFLTPCHDVSGQRGSLGLCSSLSATLIVTVRNNR